MRIAFINATKRWGGVKTWMLEFAKIFSKKGHHVYIYGRQEAFITSAQKEVGHGQLVSFGLDLNPKSILYFWREFRLHQIDIVIVNIEKDLSTAGIAAKLSGIPVIQRIGLPHDIPYRLKTRLIHTFINPSFLCPCEYIASGFKKSLPYIPPQQVKVIMNGRKATSEFLKVHSPLKFICTQQLEPNKCHSVLLEAFARVKGNFEFHIWGTGSEEKTLKQMASELGLTDQVFFHGFSDNIISKLEKGDIFLLASVSEGLPNTLIEAMSVGLLPIVRLVGGVDEVLTPELRDWVLPYDASAEDFQKVISMALSLSVDELTGLRESAREACRRFFDIDIQATKLEEWFYEVVNREV